MLSHDCARLADAKGLSNPAEVEGLREKVYASLESYTKQKYPEQPGRYATRDMVFFPSSSAEEVTFEM